ncbi:hypothetical protein BGW36DRAFT_381141 [Talaromyces proteolyticus]|uniref:Uncharacterized protein n=1 Tax=Talaromyces proteolyticus TaxID=1131652 RepID=A0AAD4KTE1_9EURO|nr:uncharacterized protein BGW36DRAFT_381141 [Talaromyces proteolyticus]KAH8696510.1 hypothetical protein BGW36DRAFT_381141 [Talaromyces proteolyticus]
MGTRIHLTRPWFWRTARTSHRPSADFLNLHRWKSSLLLAYLSACGTSGIRDERFIDESIHEEMRDSNVTDESVCGRLQTTSRREQGRDIEPEGGEIGSLD